MSKPMPPISRSLGEDSDIFATYRPDYDDLTIAEGAFSLTLERDEIEILAKLINRVLISEDE